MAQDTESRAEALQVLETTEATAEQVEIAIASVASPPEPTVSAAVEVPQFKEKTSNISMSAHDDEEVAQKKTGSATELEPVSGNLDKDHLHIAFSNEDHEKEREDEGAADEGEVEVEVDGEVVGEEGQQMKLKRDRKKSRMEAMNKRFSFGLHTDAVLEKQEEAEEEESSSSSSILDNFEDEGSDKEESLPKEPTMHGIFGALGKAALKGDDNLFYKDSKYDLSIIGSIRSSQSTRSSRVKDVDTIQMKEEFLRNFEMPSLSDISDEHEPETMSQLADLDDVQSHDKGHFVIPLADDLSSSSSTSENDSLLRYVDQDDTFPVASPHGPSSADNLDIPDVRSDDAQRKITFEDIPKGFQNLEIHDEDEEEVAKRLIVVSMMVQEFVEDLVTKSVAAYENRLWENKLRSKCDRWKLVVELRSVVDAHIFEKYSNDMLSNRLSDYFKRGRNHRVFAKLDEEKEYHYFERYNVALTKLDHLKLRLQEIKYKYAKLIVRVNLELDSAQNCGANTESKLEQKIHKLIVRPDSDFLKRYVDWALRQMNAKRNEISDMRIGLITKKDTLGRLQAKLKQLETLSSTVSIQDFISIQNDVINLEKKVEERNVDLNKMRTQYLTEVHLTHQNREKALALADKLKHQKNTLANAIGKQRSLRATLYNLKVDRTKLRDKRKELTFQGGILAMPSLMYEYDNTVLQIKGSQERVAKLRETAKVISRRISQAESAGRSA